MINWTKVGVVIAALALVGSLGFSWYTIFYKQPDLTYEKLPEYTFLKENCVQAIILKNVGRAPAHDVFMKILTGTPLIEEGLFIESPEDYYVEWSENFYGIEISFERITHGTAITINLAGENPYFDYVDISLTSEEGHGREVTPTSPPPSPYETLSNMAVGAFFTFAIIFLIIYLFKITITHEKGEMVFRRAKKRKRK